jgi:uncharacterized membrane protein
LNPGVLAAAPVWVQVHVVAAVLAAVLGAVQFLRRKGTGSHRALGRVWVGAMAVTAVSSVLMVGSCAVDGFSVIHLLTAFTLFMLPFGVVHARQGRIREHRSEMIWLYMGAIVVAGAFTLAPGRLLHDMVFGTAMLGTACAGSAV